MAEGDFDGVTEELAGVNRAGWVPHDSGLHEELRTRVELYVNLNARWPGGALPESVVNQVRDRSNAAQGVVSGFNQQLVERAWEVMGVSRNPQPYMDAITEEASEAIRTACTEIQARQELIDGWPEDPVPQEVMRAAKDRSLQTEDVVDIFDDHLLEVAWKRVEHDQDPRPYHDAVIGLENREMVSEAVDRYELILRMKSRWPEGNLPESVLGRAKDRSNTEKDVVLGFNERLVEGAWKRVENARDPKVYFDAVIGLDSRKMVRGAVDRHELILKLKSRWPEGDLPAKVAAFAMDRSNGAKDVVEAFNAHLLESAWEKMEWLGAYSNAITTDWKEALQPELDRILDRRNQIGGLQARWPNWWSKELPESVMRTAMDASKSNEQVGQVFADAAAEYFERDFKEVNEGPWRELDDMVSATTAKLDLNRLLGALKLTRLDAERPLLKERARALYDYAEQQESLRMDRDVQRRGEAARLEKILNPLGWKVLDSTPGVRGLARKVQEPVSGMVFVLIDPGKFTMGSPASEKGRVKRSETGSTLNADLWDHQVNVQKAFYLGEMEVTQGQWKQVMGSNPPAAYGNKRGEVDADHPLEPKRPVESLSRSRAKKFLATLTEMNPGRQPTFRLPMEEEWEFACRAGTQTPFSFGREISRESANFGGGEGYGESTPVGTFAPNPWGLYDMHGNVAEWCEDEYEDGKVVGRFVVKGGEWSSRMNSCRSASRAAHDDWENEKTAHGRGGLGLRVAFTAPR